MTLVVDYSIGTTVGNLVTLDTLGLPAPHATFLEFTVAVERADALIAGLGRGLAVWSWGFITQSQYNALRTGYCTGKSASVVIRTLKDDGTFANFNAVIIWPKQAVPKNESIIGFVLNFLLIEEL